MARLRLLIILGILIASVGSIAAQSSRGIEAPNGAPPATAPRTVNDPGDGSSDIAFIDSLRNRSYGGGEIEIVRYVAVDDCGRQISPLLVDGQVHGGLAQGIAQALWEEVVYDDQGQLVTGTLMDYAIPKSEYLPMFENDRTVTPSPLNPLGAKGIGELATIGSTPAIVNAVVDALSPFGIRHLDMPLKPQRIWQALADAQGNLSRSAAD